MRRTELIRFKPGVDPEGVEFETGYDKAALHSWETFSRLRVEGVIPEGVRFQVCLPTPMASGCMYVSPASFDAYLEVYERHLLRALDAILAAVPHQDLWIQWDVCQEVLVFENYFPNRPADYKDQVLDELARLGNAVPEEVELGYHLCYGTPNDEHLVMPKDAGILTEMANGIAGRLSRRLDFLHLPVPADRNDDAYFAPLEKLALGSDAALYLGLIHHGDHEADMDRIAAAARTVPAFGISTECGWERTAPERVPGIIAAHRQAMEALDA